MTPGKLRMFSFAAAVLFSLIPGVVTCMVDVGAGGGVASVIAGGAAFASALTLALRALSFLLPAWEGRRTRKTRRRGARS
ncbi:hypothetical protein ACQP2F_25690 [Actinoplanes sp. CA-030573]|uniref:hypothetical protein n=1 Tax=Actinoplanes sp. CA-030573 TaxID=3239898 RepID=UPI003D8D1AB8